MVRIGLDTQHDTTAYVDLKEDLPGTAKMLFLTEKKLRTVVEFLQLLPLRLYRIYSTNRLVTPFIMALWRTPVLKVPEWCGVIKNTQYNKTVDRHQFPNKEGGAHRPDKSGLQHCVW